MKNQQFQNNLILSIVAGVLALIGAFVIVYNKPNPIAPPDPEKVPTVTVATPPNLVIKSNGLPAGSSNNDAGGAGGGAGLAGGGGSPAGAGGRGGASSPELPSMAGTNATAGG